MCVMSLPWKTGQAGSDFFCRNEKYAGGSEMAAGCGLEAAICRLHGEGVPVFASAAGIR